MNGLDLDGNCGNAETLDITSLPQREHVSHSSTALVVDEWSRLRGAALSQEQRFVATGLDVSAACDFHTLCFEPQPQLVDKACVDQQRFEFIRELLTNTNYHQLHQQTQLFPLGAELAAIHYAEAFAALEKSGKAGDDISRVVEAQRATQQAVKSVTEVADVGQTFGLDGGGGGTSDTQKITALYQRVRRSPQLQKVVELAGRYRLLARSQQMRKTPSTEDLQGIVQDGDVARLLPHELAALCDDDEDGLSLEAMRRLVERQSLCRDYTATEPIGKGPVVFVVDESGSMLGNPSDNAKALALAMAWVARRQKRWCSLVAFSDERHGHRVLSLPYGGWHEDAVIHWLTEFLGGGTLLPLAVLPEILKETGAPTGSTDVVFVTDGICAVADEVIQKFLDWKKKSGTKVYSLVINSPAVRDAIGLVSDVAYSVPVLDAQQSAVEKILSL